MPKRVTILFVLCMILLGMGCTGWGPVQEPLSGKIAAIVWTSEPDQGGFTWIAGTGAVLVVNADGTEERLLTSPEGWRCPRWSPNGDRLALVNWDLMDGPSGNPYGYTGDIYIVEPGASRQILLGKTHSCAIWSPDGGKLLFFYEGALHIVDIATGERTTLTQLRPTRGQLNWMPDWSSDGRTVIFDEDGSIYEINASAPGKKLILQPQPRCSYYAPRYSPDGQITTLTQVCQIGESSWSSQVCVMAFENLELVCLHTGTAPNWSPDGTRIAFLDEGKIKVMNRDGSGVRTMVQSQQWQYIQLDWGR